MNELDHLLHLRALREDRAARVAAAARGRLNAAQAAQAETRAALSRHDRDTAQREARLHDAMIARGFDLAALRETQDRALLNSALRDVLGGAVALADAAVDATTAEAAERANDHRRAALRHEALRDATADLRRALREHAAARLDEDAEETGRR